MKQKMKKEFLLFIAICFSFFIKAEDNLFKKGTEFYDSGNYQMSIAYFDSLISSGIISSEIHYNKGNCYAKDCHDPSAINLKVFF